MDNYNLSPSPREENPAHLVSVADSEPSVQFDNDRTTFVKEDPRAIPYCDADIEAINRAEDELWFGKR